MAAELPKFEVLPIVNVRVALVELALLNQLLQELKLFISIVVVGSRGPRGHLHCLQSGLLLGLTNDLIKPGHISIRLLLLVENAVVVPGRLEVLDGRVQVAKREVHWLHELLGVVLANPSLQGLFG